MQKQLIDHERVRHTPTQFSWVDHRLVRGNYLLRASAPAWALYLVLVTVGDEHGLRYYAPRTLARLLSLSEDGVAEARRQLIAAGVLAYAEPLYQVLGLASAPTLTPTPTAAPTLTPTAVPTPTSPAARPLAQEVTS
ncbi:hypothetical protein LBMAG56_53560 [Verrucomicrobiota bacterium]|nr:hypothetical protein LBMAG56_53560 [Verrucomicrobiota bacterium]